MSTDAAPIVCIGQPIYESSPAAAHTAFAQMAVHSVAAGIDVRLGSVTGCFVDVARNVLAEWALDEGASHLLMVDADVVPPPDALLRLLARGVPVVGALYPLRKPPFRPAGVVRDSERPDYAATGLHRVELIGTGCVLIEVGVFQTLGVGEVGAWFQANAATGVAEDTFFSWACAGAAIPVYLDAEVRCGHVAPLVVTPGRAGAELLPA